uniref:Uncharacterized protein n=1 Tax=Arsenophonus endosymbiont of Trialeurodes vaporariorum TaxID=235567 RepID=A0A3B0M1Y1_9GAMM
MMHEIINFIYRISMNLFCFLGVVISMIMLTIKIDNSTWFAASLRFLSIVAITSLAISMLYILFFSFNRVFLK